MNKKLVILIVISVFFGNYVAFSQQTTLGLSIPDSLLLKNYSELDKRFKKNNTDTLKSTLYLNAYLQKAMLDKDSLKIPLAYFRLSFYEKNDSIKLLYINKSLRISQNINDRDYIANAYNLKGLYYLDKWNYNKALEYLLKAVEYSKKSKNKFYYYSRHNIGILKSRLGKYDEALEVFKESLNYEKQRKRRDRDTIEYVESIHSVAEAYSNLKQIDSSNVYINQGLSLLTQDRRMLCSRLVLLKGINQYQKRKYKEAKSTLKTIGDLSNFEDKTGLVKLYFYLGKIHEENNKIDLASTYFKKNDSIFQSSGHVIPEMRGNYLSLLKFAKQENDNEAQLFFIKRLLSYDSIVNANNWQLNEGLIKEYDSPQLLLEKERLLQNSNVKQQKYELLTWCFLLLFIISLVLFSIQYRKRKVYKNRFNDLLTSNKKDSTTTNDTKFSSIKTIGISKQVIQEISIKIDRFEENLGFLKPNVTTISLARQLNTNAKYLSKVIHHTKGEKFTHYINSLRVNYAIEKLKTDTKFRRYTIKAISTEIGFSNTKSFSRSFYKNTGLSPSFFIKQLNKHI